MKATACYNGEKAAGIRAANFDLEIPDCDIDPSDDTPEYRRDIRESISNLFTTLRGDRPDWVILSDECPDCGTTGYKFDGRWVCKRADCPNNLAEQD